MCVRVSQHCETQNVQSILLTAWLIRAAQLIQPNSIPPVAASVKQTRYHGRPFFIAFEMMLTLFPAITV
jgi:hypothetical protein